MKQLVALAFALLSFAVQAQDSLQFLSATTGAASYEVAVYNDYLYSGTGSTLQIFHTGGGATPPYTKTFEHRFTSIIDDIQILGDTLYIAANHAGVSKWYLQPDPSQPTHVATWHTNGFDESAYDISFKGDSLFIANKTKVTILKDEGNALTRLTDFAEQTAQMVRIRGGAMKGNLYAFTLSTMALISFNPDGVHIYDANTLTPISNHLEPFGDAEDVLFGQNTDLLHVLGGGQSTSWALNLKGLFYSLNIANPATPTLAYMDTLDIYPIPGFAIGNALNAEIVNDTIYLATQAAEDSSTLNPVDGNIYVYDATNAGNVHPLTVLDAGLWHFDVAMQNSTLHIASEWFGVRSLDVSNLYNPINLGDTPTGGWNIGADIHGNKMVLANEGYGIKLFDISDPTNPILTNEHINISNGFCMNVNFSTDGNYVFGSYLLPNDGFRVFDLNLNQVASLPDFTGAERTWVWQNKVVALAKPYVPGPTQLNVIDVSNPLIPSVETTINIEANDLLVDDGKVFVTLNDTLIIYALNNGLQEMNRYTNANSEYGAMAKHDDTLFVYQKNLGLVRYTFDEVNHTLTATGTITFPEGDPKYMAADSLGLYVGFLEFGVHAYNKSTLAYVDHYHGGLDFYHPALWGIEDLKAIDGYVVLVEYFEQTTLLKFDNEMINAIGTATPLPQLPAYPNPIEKNEVLRIPVAPAHQQAPLQLTITDARGRILQSSQHVGTPEVSCHGLSQGAYFFSLQAAGETIGVGRFVVQ